MNNPDIGKLLLRVSLALMLLLHGLAKLQHGVAWISSALQGMGLPGFFAYGVFIGEIIAPLMVLVGYQMRIGALLIVGNMFAALVIAHRGEFFSLNATGGWAIELQAFYLLVALALVFLGPGKYALRR